MPDAALTHEDALAGAATVTVPFRGRSLADVAIRALSDAPVNHVGMDVVLDDLPPLLGHAEMGQSLPDVWTGQHQRGVQLHRLGDAVRRRSVTARSPTCVSSRARSPAYTRTVIADDRTLRRPAGARSASRCSCHGPRAAAPRPPRRRSTAPSSSRSPGDGRSRPAPGERHDPGRFSTSTDFHLVPPFSATGEIAVRG